MRLVGGREPLMVGIDYRESMPLVCYQNSRMREPELLSLDFREQELRVSVFCKILSALKRFGKKEDMRVALVLPDVLEETLRQYQQDALSAGFMEEQLLLLSETESLVHFVMHQSNDIWAQGVWVLEFLEEEVKASCVVANRRTSPVLVKMEEPEYWYIGGESDSGRDERLAEMVNDRFRKCPVSAVFLAHTDFSPEIYKKSREAICQRRRVFLAEHMYARGACMAVLTQTAKPGYLFLNEQTLLYNTGIRCRKGMGESVQMLLSAGESWYDAKISQEVILLDEPVLEFVFSPMLGGEELCFGMGLTDLPRRPDRATRLRLDIHFSGPGQCEVKVTDLGFGELYPASDLYWMDTFLLEEDDHGSGNDLSRETGENTLSGGADGAWTL